MFEFCMLEIKGIQFFFIEKEIMRSLRDEKSFLSKRFDPTDLYYLPGTKSFHHYTPISTEEIGVKRVSTDQEYEFIFNFKTGKYREETEIGSSPTQQPTISISGGEYVVCMCEGKRRVGVVMSINDEEKEAKIRFMYPPLPTTSLSWPSRIVECNVPLLRILMELTPPISTTSSGRSYSVTSDDLEKINALH